MKTNKSYINQAAMDALRELGSRICSCDGHELDHVLDSIEISEFYNNTDHIEKGRGRKRRNKNE